jgi:hypothetical protein
LLLLGPVPLRACFDAAPAAAAGLLRLAMGASSSLSESEPAGKQKQHQQQKWQQMWQQ